MIPYALCMISFQLEGERTLELRALDPTQSGLTFRVPASYEDTITHPTSIRLAFLDYAKKQYKIIMLSEYSITQIPDFSDSFMDSASGKADSQDVTISTYQIYELTSEEPCFQTALQSMLHDYMHYIRLKTEESDETLMRELCGFEFSEEYASDEMSWKHMMVQHTTDHPMQNSDSESHSKLSLEEIDIYNALLPVELAISLDCPHLWRAFLTQSYEDFQETYWRENGLLSDSYAHPITTKKITHIYIGNSYCPFLRPGIEEIGQILEKCSMQSLTPVLVYPPMAEDQIPAFREELIRIAERYKSIAAPHKSDELISRNELHLELVCNDLGLPHMVHELEASGQIPRNFYTLTTGTLLVKRKKDFRMRYYMKTPMNDIESEDTTSIDASFYRAYLAEQYGFTRYSYEVCGMPIAITEESILHLPLYQMNTATYCTLYAQCVHGDRGHQAPIHSCPQYCESQVVLYPKNLPMIGRFNSIFGCSIDEMNSVNELNRMIRSGVRRLVVRL